MQEEKINVLKDFTNAMLFKVKERIISRTRDYTYSQDEQILEKIKMDLYLLDEIENYAFADGDMIYDWYENYYQED